MKTDKQLQLEYQDEVGGVFMGQVANEIRDRVWRPMDTQGLKQVKTQVVTRIEEDIRDQIWIHVGVVWEGSYGNY